MLERTEQLPLVARHRKAGKRRERKRERVGIWLEPAKECPHCGGIGTLPPVEHSIGKRFRECREARNLTQEEMAPRLKVSRNQLSNIETCGNLPKLKVLVAAAREYGTTTDYLLGRV